MHEFDHEAKELKRSLERVARLRKLVLSMDKTVMATVRSYSHPPPVVHASMRALFLLLGHSLPETRVRPVFSLEQRD